MPKLPTVLTMLAALSLAMLTAAVSADVYKYRDRDGNILLTDKPMGGLKLLKRYQITTGRPSGGGRSALAAMYKRRDALAPMIDAAAADAALEPALVHAVVRAESAYRTDAVSSKGAVGLMQLMPATAKRYDVEDRTDAAQNLRGGTRYLRDLLTLFDNDLRLALAAYNAGEHNVERYGNQVPPFAETQDYVQKVVRFYRKMRDGGERLAQR